MSEHDNLELLKDLIVRELEWEERQLDSIRDRSRQTASLSLSTLGGLVVALSFLSDGSPNDCVVAVVGLAGLLLLISAAIGSRIQIPGVSNRVDDQALRRYFTPEALEARTDAVLLNESTMLLEVLESTRKLRERTAGRLTLCVQILIAGAAVGLVGLGTAVLAS